MTLSSPRSISSHSVASRPTCGRGHHAPPFFSVRILYTSSNHHHADAFSSVRRDACVQLCVIKFTLTAQCTPSTCKHKAGPWNHAIIQGDMAGRRRHESSNVLPVLSHFRFRHDHFFKMAGPRRCVHNCSLAIKSFVPDFRFRFGKKNFHIVEFYACYLYL